MDEGKLRKKQERGERAKRLLENELLIEGFEKLEISLTEAWKNSHPQDAARREDAWRSLILLGKLREGLKKVVTTGTVANKQLLELKEPSLLRKMIDG